MILRRKFKLRDVHITCFVLTLLAIGMFVIHVVPKERTLRSLRPQISDMDSNPSSAGIGTTKAAAKEAVDTSLSLFVRMSGKLPDHRQRYYCDLFRTTVLYWPSSYGKIVLVLDEETEEDHKFGDKIMDQTKRYFPDRKLEVLYEALPKDKSTLDFPGIHRKPGYNRQLWSVGVAFSLILKVRTFVTLKCPLAQFQYIMERINIVSCSISSISVQYLFTLFRYKIIYSTVPHLFSSYICIKNVTLKNSCKCDKGFL